jgi:uncharacterized membrane protein
MTTPNTTFIKKDIFRQAWKLFKSKWGLLIGIYAIMIAVNITFTTLGNTSPVFIGVIKQIAQIVMVLGLAQLMILMVRGNDVSIKNWLGGITFRIVGVGIVAGFLYSLAILLGSILLIIPGIFIALIMSMHSYLIVDQNRGIIASLGESIRITKGHRWNLFLFFICMGLWNLLGVLALGVGVLITAPFTGLAMVLVYDYLVKAKGE